MPLWLRKFEMINKIYFISGSSGVGKTAIIPHLKLLLPKSFEIHDFDEGGVPTGADHLWRISRTREWVGIGEKKTKDGLSLIVSGFANPEEIEVIKKDFPNLEIKIILLDGDEKVTEQRLRNRNNNSLVKADLERVVGSAEKFIENNTNFTPILREICKKSNCPIIDTTNLSPKSVAKKVVEFIK